MNGLGECASCAGGMYGTRGTRGLGAIVMEPLRGGVGDGATSAISEMMAGAGVAAPGAMMLGSAIQAGFGGRPELIVDALKEGPKSLVATALTVVVIDVLIQGGDVLAEVAWQSGRADTMAVLDTLADTMGAAGGRFAARGQVKMKHL